MSSLRIGLVDYGSGNIRSVTNALRNVKPEAELLVTSDPQALADVSHMILPGVGAFGDCLRGLQAVPGLIEQLTAHKEAGKPFLGICVGMQLLADTGLEHGTHKGLGWIPGTVAPLADALSVKNLAKNSNMLKIPHMGWNQLTLSSRDAPAMQAGLGQPLDGADVYFVHSYFFQAALPETIAATTTYGDFTFPAVVAKDSIIGTQFHPEKSQATGLAFLKTFLEWKP